MATHANKVEVKKTTDKGAPPPSHFDWSRPLTDLRHEVDRVFENFLTGWPRAGDFGRLRASLSPYGAGLFEVSPSVDVSETDKAYEIAVELPGMDEKDVELTLRDDTLTLSGEKKTEKEEKKKKDYVLSERNYGSFKRAFRLPEGVKADKIVAEMKKGVMTITLPKSPVAQEKKRRIAIHAK